jgi:hypothetical protein
MMHRSDCKFSTAKSCAARVDQRHGRTLIGSHGRRADSAVEARAHASSSCISGMHNDAIANTQEACTIAGKSIAK